VREAHVLPAAVGKPRFIAGADIKPGAVVIDAGCNEAMSATSTSRQLPSGRG
jgi:5,10-methylene-tetrahydrofolate dehydrogenase/methenyl tetrahydrofolate cyclohydrolase